MKSRKPSSFEVQTPFLIRILARSPHTERCDDCGRRMFVKYASGLCPFCWNACGRPRTEEVGLARDPA